MGGGSLRRRAEAGAVAVIGAVAAATLCYLFLRWLAVSAPAVGPVAWLRPGADRALDLLVGRGLCRAGGAVGLDLFCFGFVVDSFATGVLIGIVGPLIGTYLVHREMALIGETLAHTAFAGVAVGFLFSAATGWSTPLLLSALVASLVGAFAVQYLAERTDAYGDVPIAIMLTGSFALGTLIINYGGGFSGLNIESFLFGSIAYVSPGGAQLMGALSVAVIALVATNYKQLLFVTFDEQAARVARLDVRRYNTLLVVMTAVVVVGSIQILGVILVAAMLVVPVAAASQVARSFRETLYLSIVVGEAAVVAGMLLSGVYGLAAGGAIVMVAIGVYLVAVAASGRLAGSIGVH